MDKTELTHLLQKDAAGFTNIRAEAEKTLHKLSPNECLQLAKEMYASDVYQNRMFAVLIFGALAATRDDAYIFLKTKVVPDDNWRVQEMLARAFDQYCKDRGYEKSLPEIQEWLGAKHPNQRRAASEGLRIWTSRPYFKEHPEIAIQLLSALKADESEYVRTSIGNALRDISKQFSELIKRELKTWDTSDKRVQLTYKLAGKFVVK